MAAAIRNKFGRISVRFASELAFNDTYAKFTPKGEEAGIGPMATVHTCGKPAALVDCLSFLMHAVLLLSLLSFLACMDVEAPQYELWTPEKQFLAACSTGDIETVRQMVSLGMDPSMNRNAPVIQACLNQQTDVIQFLCSFQSVDPRPCLAMAISQRNFDAVKILYSHPKVRKGDIHNTAIRLACRAGSPKIFVYLSTFVQFAEREVYINGPRIRQLTRPGVYAGGIYQPLETPSKLSSDLMNVISETGHGHMVPLVMFSTACKLVPTADKLMDWEKCFKSTSFPSVKQSLILFMCSTKNMHLVAAIAVRKKLNIVNDFLQMLFVLAKIRFISQNSEGLNLPAELENLIASLIFPHKI